MGYHIYLIMYIWPLSDFWKRFEMTFLMNLFWSNCIKPIIDTFYKKSSSEELLIVSQNSSKFSFFLLVHTAHKQVRHIKKLWLSQFLNCPVLERALLRFGPVLKHSWIRHYRQVPHQAEIPLAEIFFRMKNLNETKSFFFFLCHPINQSNCIPVCWLSWLEIGCKLSLCNSHSSCVPKWTNSVSKWASIFGRTFEQNFSSSMH